MSTSEKLRSKHIRTLEALADLTRENTKLQQTIEQLQHTIDLRNACEQESSDALIGCMMCALTGFNRGPADVGDRENVVQLRNSPVRVTAGRGRVSIAFRRRTFELEHEAARVRCVCGFCVFSGRQARAHVIGEHIDRGASGCTNAPVVAQEGRPASNSKKHTRGLQLENTHAWPGSLLLPPARH